ncbi:hypothetical protein [Stenotrophomonas rhizophila]|uniref:hypothetical protein n=1 Tax=Stenotrophomonas rhizophila TaxID=216778 RepID=UPI001E44BFE2|nr:hypothetical protein [Stenotrophomonas rhizophila]MCC7635491.1 hypothetical protein [Stenotrophomonas rhizophila]MCC7664743.1 hypothetical protein [Stenotrophomonas rhizophila]
MNRMRRRRTTHAVTAASALLLFAWLGTPDGDAGGAAGSALPGPQDAGVIQAGTADDPPARPRRLHSSLSMPYFSFAQSLNPRS